MKRIASIISIALFLILLNGCLPLAQAPKNWYKSGVSNDQMRRDMMTCRQYGMQSAQSHGVAGNLFVESWIQNAENAAMKSATKRSTALNAGGKRRVLSGGFGFQLVQSVYL